MTGAEIINIMWPDVLLREMGGMPALVNYTEEVWGYGRL